MLSNTCSIIQQLAEDENESVRCAIARRKDLSNDLIHKLAEDESYLVRWEIDCRKNINSKLTQELTKDKDTDVLQVIDK